MLGLNQQNYFRKGKNDIKCKYGGWNDIITNDRSCIMNSFSRYMEIKNV